MKVKLPFVKNVKITGEYIKLDSLLKHASVVQTGGEAKELITGGAVSVNGETVTERGRKIRGGMLVGVNNQLLRVIIQPDDAVRGGEEKRRSDADD